MNGRFARLIDFLSCSSSFRADSALGAWKWQRAANRLLRTRSRLNENDHCGYDAIISDVLAAYNMGLVGSTKIDPRFSGSNIVVGGKPSGQWYSVGGTPYATNPRLAPEQLFSYMQPNSPAGTPFYNPFAAYLAPITDAYGSRTRIKPRARN